MFVSPGGLYLPMFSFHGCHMFHHNNKSTSGKQELGRTAVVTARWACLLHTLSAQAIIAVLFFLDNWAPFY